ncbi:hypothetical protein [Photobacterium nomapromontoriensis]|uniref:hypothetical protein n=1 Tax=Photobacterium nomapromontoriensis TaxID=2910237 RepID=UPI003D12B5DD
MKALRKIWVIIFLNVFSGQGVDAATIDIELAYFSKVNHLVNQGRYEQAAEQWHRLTIAFLSSEARLGQRHMWQYAGLSEALAAMAADKANKVSAYQYWADSTRYLMTGGTNWMLMKKKLHRRFELANTQLSSQLQIADVVASVDIQWQQELNILQVWNEKLAMFSFASPKLGMVEDRSFYTQDNITDESKRQGRRGQGSPYGKKLSGLKSDFSQEQQFVPNHGEVSPVSDHHSSTTLPQTAVSSTEIIKATSVKDNLESTVISAAIEPLDFEEENVSVLPSLSLEASAGLVPEHAEPEIMIGILPRGILDRAENTGVKAIQRRSFAPVPDE